MNLKIQSKRLQFLVKFLIISMIFLVLWKPLSIAIMYFLGFLATGVFEISGTGIDVKIISGSLYFDYTEVFSQNISFPLRDIDQIYLNIIILFSLLISTPNLSLQKRVRYMAICLFIMTCIYILILHIYSYTFLRDYLTAKSLTLDENIMIIFRENFSEGRIKFYEKILFHWNSWGWDVIPLFLWLPAGYKRVIILPRRVDVNGER